MSKHHAKQGQPAGKTIEDVFQEFLEEQAERLKRATFRKYEDIIGLLRSSLNSYAHQGLDEEEAALFDRLYNAEGDEHREFCEVFGPEKISENLGEFLDYFMVRKVICGKELKHAAGTVTKRLGKWLAEKGYITTQDAEDVVDRGTTAARELPAAEELAQMLADYADSMPVDCDDVVEDHFLVTAVEPGKLHLSGFIESDNIRISIPRYLSDACRVGWSISGAIGRRGSRWHLLEVWNVYP